MRWRRMLIGCLLLVVAACGGGDDSSTSRASTSTTAAAVGPALRSKLPSIGIAESYPGGTRLRALDGTLLADLPRYVVHSNTVPGGPLYVYEWDAADPQRYGPALRLDAAHARWVEARPPPEPGAALSPPPVPAGTSNGGHWRWAVPSPIGDVRLAQWSGECEVPAAFFVDPDGVPRSVLGGDWLDAPNTSAAGWLPDGRALVEVDGPDPACGTGSPEPGVYAIDPDTGTRERFAAIAGGILWG